MSGAYVHSRPQNLRRTLLLVLLIEAVLVGRHFAASATTEIQLFDRATGYRINHMIGEVPLRIDGGVTLGIDELEALVARADPVLIDVYDDRPGILERVSLGVFAQRKPRMQIEGSASLAGFGAGSIDTLEDVRLARKLKEMTGGDRTRPIVFYCLANCWTSWNAARRAIGLGYPNVHWFRDGIEAWQDAGLPVAPAHR
jgi:PQQ-dependent catabolism-associated CXXCW motif protein